MTDKHWRKSDNLKPWRKGQSGNPAGRPKKPACIPDILRMIGEEQEPKTGLTNLEAILRRVVVEARKGEPWACQFVADRLEGKPRQLLAVEREEFPALRIEIDEARTPAPPVIQ